MMHPITTHPVPVDSDWFPVRIMSVLAAGYTFREQWLDAAATWSDKTGGRRNSTSDPAFARVGTFAVDDPALCRRAPGAGGLKWELVPVESLDPEGWTGVAKIDGPQALPITPWNWLGRILVGSAWQNDGASGTAWPIDIDGERFTPKPDAHVLIWDEIGDGGRYAFMPVQYAGRVEDSPGVYSYYSGFVSTGEQYLKGIKRFIDECVFDDAVTMSSTLSVAGNVGCDSLGVTNLISGARGLFDDIWLVSSANALAISGGDLTYTSPANPDFNLASAGAKFVCRSVPGIDASFAIEDNVGTTHNFTFTGGILTSYSTTP